MAVKCCCTINGKELIVVFIHLAWRTLFFRLISVGEGFSCVMDFALDQIQVNQVIGSCLDPTGLDLLWHNYLFLGKRVGLLEQLSLSFIRTLMNIYSCEVLSTKTLRTVLTTNFHLCAGNFKVLMKLSFSLKLRSAEIADSVQWTVFLKMLL